MRPALLLMAILVLGRPALAQDEQPGDDELPTLDELLGTEGDASPDDETTELPDESEEELDRLLSGGEIAHEFRQAVDLMGRSATRLSSARDTGSRTQRMQEDVLRKLDKLIADAERRAQQQSSSPSPSSGRQQSQPQPNQQQSQPQPGDGDNRGEVSPPGQRTGALRPEEAADLAAWGSLPARVRDALVEGSTDRFSAAYRRLTEAYYRMLAEEPKQ